MHNNVSGRIHVILKATVLALLVLLTVWIFVSPPDLSREPSGSKRQIKLEQPCFTDPMRVQLKGVVADVQSTVNVGLLVNNVPISETTTRVEKGEREQSFSFSNIHLRTGKNDLEVKGATVENRRQIQAVSNPMPPPLFAPFAAPSPTPSPTPPQSLPTGLYRTPSPIPSPTPSPVLPCPTPAPLPSVAASTSFSPDAMPTPSPSPNAAVGPTVVRKLTVSLTYNRIELKLAATLPRGDDRVQKLRTSGETLPQFFLSVFGDFKIQNRRIADEFRNVTPEYHFSDQSITVTGSTDPKRQRPNSALARTIVIRPDWRGSENELDEFVLSVAGYKVSGFDPAPVSVTEEGLKWMGNQKDLLTKTPRQIEIRLDNEPLSSPGSILNHLRLTPYEALPVEAYPLVELILGFLVTVPMVWLLWLLQRFRESVPEHPGFRTAMIGLARLLIGFAFAPHVFYSLQSLSSALYTLAKTWGFGRSDDPRLLIAAVILIGVISQVISLAAGFIRNARVRFTLQTTFRGIRDAGVICLSAIVGIVTALKFVPYNIIGLPQLLTTAIAGISALLLLATILRLYLSRPNKNALPSRAWAVWLAVATLVLIILSLAYPFHPGGVMDVVITNVHNQTLDDARLFFFLLLNLLPYILFSAIVILLSQLEPNTKERKRMLYGVGALIFAGYLVGSTPSWFMIPIPFFVGLWLFRRYVIVRPAKYCFGHQELRDQIWSDRRSMLQRYFTTNKHKQLQETREELDKNRLAGDVSDTDYRALKEDLERRLADLEKNSRLDGGIRLHDVVVGIGPCRTNWENGRWAVGRGSVFALLFSALYLWELLQRDIWPARAYYLLGVVSPFLAFFAYWLVSAFFFGYFFTCIRGNSGLRKGVRTSAAVILSLLPIWLLSSTGLISIFLRAGQTFVFFTLLGLMADYRVFRAALGDKFEWKSFMQFEEISNFVAFATVIVTSLGTSVQSALAGHFDSVIRDLVNMAFQQLPKIPPF